MFISKRKSADWFNQNFSEGEFVEMVNAGKITLPNRDALEPLIDIDVIADVAIAALTDSRHDGEVYEVTGPDLLRFADVAGKLSEATSRQIESPPDHDRPVQRGAYRRRRS